MNSAQAQSIILPFLHKYGVKKADLFGSCARGDATGESDIDLLVELPQSASLLDYIGLKQDLEDALGRNVDLVEYDAIKPKLRPYILRDIRPILSA